MKKLLSVILVIVLSVMCFCLSACDKKNSIDKDITLIVIDADNNSISYNYQTSQICLKDMLDDMQNEKVEANGKVFTYEYSDGAYGAFVNGVIGFTVSGNNFWGIYTSVLENGMEEYSITFEEKSYYSTSLGISDYKISDGETLVFKYSVY